MSSSKLKSCPFCGSDKVDLRREHDTEADLLCTFVFVECRTCRARSGSNWFWEGNDCPQFYEEIRERWNTRQGPEELSSLFQLADAHDAGDTDWKAVRQEINRLR